MMSKQCAVSLSMHRPRLAKSSYELLQLYASSKVRWEAPGTLLLVAPVMYERKGAFDAAWQRRLENTAFQENDITNK